MYVIHQQEFNLMCPTVVRHVTLCKFKAWGLKISTTEQFDKAICVV